MQLLKITSTPIEYQYKIERARLEAKRDADLGFQVDRQPSALRIQSDNIQVRLDTREARRRVGLKTAADEISDAAQRGRQAAYEATGQYAVEGNQMAKGVDVTQIVADRLFNQQPTTTQVFLPSVGPVITWKPNEISMKYDPGDINFDWQMMRNTMDYVPGKFTMNILQYPKVTIEYLGKPTYVPPSAAPDYQEPA